MDFHTVQDWANNELNKTDFGRMPWHDVAMALVGPSVVDIAEHFVQRWNHIKRDKYKRDEKCDWLCLTTRAKADGSNPDEDLIAIQRPKHPVGEYVEHPLSPLEGKNLQNQGSVTAQIVRSSDDWSSGILNDQSIQNAYKEVIDNAQHYVYIENQFFITATGEQQSPIHNTIGRHIADACIRAGKENRKFRVIIVIPAIPGFAGDLRDDAAIGTRAIMDYQYKSICRGENSIMGQIEKAGFDPHKYVFVFNLRAYDRLNKTPALIQQEKDSGVTYQELQRAEAEEIMGTGIHGYDAEHNEPDSKSKNKVGIEADEQDRIIDRKRKFEAARKNLDVKDPMHSADSIAEDAMARGGLVSEEPWEGDDKEAEKDNFVQEELYIHAKLLIADDKIVVCGSSNLNDRSQLGSHDSELSIVMQDARELETTMDGQPYTAGYHAASLRRHLWREHLGLIEAQQLDASKDPNAQPPTVAMNEEYSGDEWEFVADPLSDKVWDLWTKQATVNTDTYRYLFRADPDNAITTWKGYDEFAPKHKRQGHLHDPYMPVKQVREELDKIRGHLVWMPLDFLKDEEMAEKGLQVNSYTEVSFSPLIVEAVGANDLQSVYT
jgi:phospholipase D1/2